MCFKRVSVPSDGWISRKDFLTILSRQGIKPISSKDPLDKWVKLASKKTLNSIASKLVYPEEWYTEELWDCEQYALQASLDAGKLGISVVLCIGWMRQEDGLFVKHGFALTVDTNQVVWVMENNSGYPWSGKWHTPSRDKRSVAEGAYFPKKVFI